MEKNETLISLLHEESVLAPWGLVMMKLPIPLTLPVKKDR